MQELHDQISDRCQRVAEVVKGPITSDRFRILKDEERVRVEKENFILSMMRSSRGGQTIAKHQYYKYSFEIMRKINPQFKHQLNLQRIQDSFLNDFVGLYRHFFFKYQEMFNFKLKLQNLIRPTNHNLVIDLVKYLVDFSRDYYQQTFFWYMKSLCKIQPIQEEESKDLQQCDDQKPVIFIKKPARTSFNQIILTRSQSKREEQDQVKKDPLKNYDVLDILIFPTFNQQPKDPNFNIQVLKIRANQLFRQMKSRNVLLKQSMQNYYNRYYADRQDNKTKQYIENEDDSLMRAAYPLKISLVVEKNGFNYLIIQMQENKFMMTKKDKKLSPLKVTQRLTPTPEAKSKPDYMLNSLKIIRISQNFLPNILGLSANIANNTTVSFPTIETNSRSNLVSSNSAANQQQMDRRAKKQLNIEQKLAKQKSFRKLSQLKRSFKSQQKRQGLLGPMVGSNNNSGSNDPQKKIYDWLDKLRLIKQIQRKKIMGLS